MDLFDIIAARQGNGNGNQNESFRKRWYVLPIDEFQGGPMGSLLRLKTYTISENDATEYGIGLRFTLDAFKSDGDSVVPTTSLPIEAVKDDDYSVNWTNQSKFPSIGVIIPTLSPTFPLDLYEQFESFVDGTNFHRMFKFMRQSGFSVGYYHFDFGVALYSHSEEAVNTLLAEMNALLPEITHCCIAYDNYEIIEANKIGG